MLAWRVTVLENGKLLAITYRMTGARYKLILVTKDCYSFPSNEGKEKKYKEEEYKSLILLTLLYYFCIRAS